MTENEFQFGQPAPVVTPPTLTAAPGFWDSNPKTMFYTGLFLGLASASTVGLVLILGAMWSGKVVGGTPASAAAVAVNTAVADPTAAQPDAVPSKPVAAFDAKTDHWIGNKDAKVTLIEYSDFQCPYCLRFDATIKEIMKKYPKDVKLVFRQFPLTSIHQYAQKAAEASECVAKIGGNDAFWKMHDKLFVKQGQGDLTEDVLLAAANEIGVDKNKVKTCLDSGEMKSKVDAQFATGNDSGVQGTPATFINGKLVSGALPTASFEPEVVSAGAKN